MGIYIFNKNYLSIYQSSIIGIAQTKAYANARNIERFEKAMRRMFDAIKKDIITRGTEAAIQQRIFKEKEENKRLYGHSKYINDRNYKIQFYLRI